MTQHYKKHAEKIVEDFQEMLDPGAVEAIGKENLGGLAMLIESALTVAVVEALEQAADQVTAVAGGIRRNAENYQGD